MTYDFDLLVIGAGSGGVRCARIAAGHGARVAVVEARHWGGTCVNLGCVPKKLMVQATEYGEWAEDSRGFGWDMARGTHDWERFIGRKDHEIERLNAIYVRLLEDAGVRLFTGHARFEDAHTLLIGPGPLAPHAEPRRVTAARIVIATGGKPVVQPHIEGQELGIVSDDAFHLKARPDRITIVGSGYIGVEFAGIFAGLGAQATMLYRQKLPLRGFDMDMRQALDEAMGERGIVRHAGALLHRIERDRSALKLTLTDGRELASDMVFFAVGRQPNAAGLGLDNTRVRVTDSGRVITHAGAVTDEPNIFAIGDVTNHQNLTPVAIAEGHILADRLFSGSVREWCFDTVPKAVFFSPPLASVGLTEDEAAAKGPADIYCARFRSMRHVLSGRNRHTTLKLVVDGTSQVVLGAHMLGEEAPEIMQGLAIAVTAGLRKSDFDRTVGIHPSSAEEFVTLRTRTRVAGATGASSHSGVQEVPA
ncbi:glutathione-disulfide reductase [Lichenicoccus sp.]|uniref:glutathione-disulfide reductase n=1 Tax=Lichenicoccus sp. TaxID=2781899 RepID=UPI003D0AE2F1